MKLFIFVLISAASIAFGQETGKPMFFENADACLAATDGNFSIYIPHFTEKLGLWQEKVSLGTAEEVKISGIACARELTVEGFKIVRWPEGSTHFKAGEKLADARCGNEVLQIWEPPPPSVPPPADANPPSPVDYGPPPTLDVVINHSRPPAEFLITGGYDEEINLEIIPEKGHKFPIPCVPREKGWYGIGLPLAECAALIYGGFEIYGAVHGVTLVKNLVCVATILPNGMKTICP